MSKLFQFDKKIAREHRVFCGIDEAGRGPLAGPVVVASVVMPMRGEIEGIDDSKKLSPKKREALYEEILKKCVCWHVAVISEKVIDEINILNATKRGMRECAESLSVRPELALVDAVKFDCEVPLLPIIKGDATSYSIAAASILAKVTRDRIMTEYDALYPAYGFAEHKGYATAKHISRLIEHGISPIHRMSFLGNFLEEIAAAEEARGRSQKNGERT